MKKIIISSILSLIIIFVFILGKQIYLYHSASSIKSPKEKIDTYARIIYLHLPFSPLEKKAIQNILELAKTHQELELYAYEILRSTIYGIRHFSTPYKRELAFLEDKIANLRTQKLLADGYKKSYEETYEEMKKIMSTDLAPNSFLALVSILSFLFFIYFTITSISKCCENNKFQYKKFAFSFIKIFIMWLIWITTLYLA